MWLIGCVCIYIFKLQFSPIIDTVHEIKFYIYMLDTRQNFRIT